MEHDINLPVNNGWDIPSHPPKHTKRGDLYVSNTTANIQIHTDFQCYIRRGIHDCVYGIHSCFV